VDRKWSGSKRHSEDRRSKFEDGRWKFEDGRWKFEDRSSILDPRSTILDPEAQTVGLRVHKSLLQRLIADGEYLLSLVGQVGLPENEAGITAESLAAAVELLQADYRGWHEPMPSEKREQILGAVFPDVS
jgi:hypothetical protein